MRRPPDRSVPVRPGASFRGPAVLLALGATLALAAAACASSEPPASAQPPGPSASAAPAASFAPGSPGAKLGSPGPLPSGTPWPGNVPDDVIALGALDEQIAAAGQAMDAGINAKDLAAVSAAAKGLVGLLDKESDNVSTLQGYPGTKTLGDAYAAAIAKMRSGAQAIVDGVAKGDATAVDAGVKDLSDGIALYGLARKALGPYLEQALSMKKMYLK